MGEIIVTSCGNNNKSQKRAIIFCLLFMQKPSLAFREAWGDDARLC